MGMVSEGRIDYRDGARKAVRTTAPRALIGKGDSTGGGRCGGPSAWRVKVLSLALVAVVTTVTFRPTLNNGFLSLAFDDAIILDTQAIRQLNWANLRAMATEYNHAHYVPLTMLSLAVDYHFWGLDPFGYHLTNVILHAATAMLACVFLCSIVPSVSGATLAALIFALHPVQMESVSLAIQRKTLLSGAGFFLTLILYQRWRKSNRRWTYAATLLAFAAAALAKPMVVTLPLVLLLYEYVFIDGRLRWADKLPFVAIAVPITWAAMAAHATVGFAHPPHGGTILTHVLMMGRVGLEYVAAALFPANLSPIYYYPRALAYEPVNAAGVVLILSAMGYLTLRRRLYPWLFFCLGWFALTLLPESNLVPLVQLRADRFLYLPILSIGLLVAIGIERLPPMHLFARPHRFPAYALGLAIATALAVTTHASAAIWQSDVSAWTRVVERHPWAGIAHHMLGRAHAAQGEAAAAELAFVEATRRNPRLPEPHLELARLYHARGQGELADLEVHRLLELSPGHPEGLALLAIMRRGDGQ